MRPKCNFKPEAWVKISDLKEHPNNPRKDLKSIPEKFESLKKSIQEGVFEPVKVSRLSGCCIAGNQRLKAFLELGYDEVPVQYNDYSNVREEVRDMVKDNNEWGEYDFSKLNFQIESLGLDDYELGLSNQEITKLDDEKLTDDEKDDNAPTLAKSTKIKRGDVYILGSHRIMCGDSTNPDDVKTLMSGIRADVVFTDPPYNVNYKGGGKKTNNTIENDHMSEEQFEEFLTDTFLRYREATKDSAPFYVCHSSSSQSIFEKAMKKVNLLVKNQIIWNKNNASMGWGDYRWKHEPIFYASYGGGRVDYYGGRNQYTVINESLSLEKLSKMIEEMEKNGESSIWSVGRDSNYEHPTQKPVELVCIALRNSSKVGQVVLDLFCGSGSTLIACEKMGRIFYGMELDPKYVDVEIRRWEEYTGEKAKLLKHDEQ